MNTWIQFIRTNLETQLTVLQSTFQKAQEYVITALKDHFFLYVQVR